MSTYVVLVAGRWHCGAAVWAAQETPFGEPETRSPNAWPLIDPKDHGDRPRDMQRGVALVSLVDGALVHDQIRVAGDGRTCAPAR